MFTGIRAFAQRAPEGETIQQQAIDVLLRTRIEIEQRSLLFTQGHLATLAGPAFALLLVALLLPYASPYALGAWWLLRVLIVTARLVLTARWRASLDPDAPVWGRRFLVLLAIDGFLWGLVGTWLIPNEMHDYAILVLTSLLGVGGFAAFVLQTRAIAILLFNVPLLVPAAVLQMLRGDLPALFAGIGMVLFVVLLGFEGWRSEQRIRELLRLRFMTDRISQERAQALALAQHHSLAKNQFLATMSHEMRTPLHGILGLARLLRGEDLAAGRPQARERLALIERSGEHLLALINDLLDLSKIEARQTLLVQEPVDLAALLDEIGGLMASSAREKNLRLVVDVSALRGGGGRVLGDPARLRQLLLNLLGNAIKFTARGEVGVAARNQDQLTVIEVRDTGIGIPADELPHIFEAFHQVDGSFARRFDGTGLGLTISRQLAQAMGGELSCSSTPGIGSVFSLRLPLPLVEAPAATPLRGAPAAAASRGQVLRGHVLLAEDNEVNALVARALLENAGLVVEVVPDGEAAVARCEQSPPDLVLMDCQMPVMDGFVATQHIRDQERLQQRPRMPIIALTANAYDSDRERCLAAGMDDHLAKPFREEELLALLRRWLPEAPGRLTAA